MSELHPAVTILKHEIKQKNRTYAQLAHGTGITEQRIKNMMTGRSQMTLSERDKICDYLHISPVNLVVSRNDLDNTRDYLDITMLPEGLRAGLYSLYIELVKVARPT